MSDFDVLFSVLKNASKRFFFFFRFGLENETKDTCKRAIGLPSNRSFCTTPFLPLFLCLWSSSKRHSTPRASVHSLGSSYALFNIPCLILGARRSTQKARIGKPYSNCFTQAWWALDREPQSPSWNSFVLKV